MSLWFERALTSDSSISQGHFMGKITLILQLSTQTSSFVRPFLTIYSKRPSLVPLWPSSCVHNREERKSEAKIPGYESRFCHKLAPWIWATYLIWPAFILHWLNGHNTTYHLGFLWRLTELILGWTYEIAKGVSKMVKYEQFHRDQPYIWSIP